MLPSDESLLLAFIDRHDRRALAQLFERYQAQAFAIARHAGLSRFDAEDAAQSAFMELIRSAPSFRRDARFAPWFFRIVVNTAFKKRGIERQRELHEEPAAEAAMEYADNQKDPQAAAADAESLRLLDETLDSLPEKLRLPIVLRYRMGLDSAQSAAALGCPENTLRTWLKRGLDELRTRFEARSGVTTGTTALAGMISLLPLAPAPQTLSAALAAAAAGKAAGAPASLHLFSRSMAFMKAHPLAVVAAAFGLAITAAICMPAVAQRGMRSPVSAPAGDPAAEERAQPVKETIMDVRQTRTLLAAAFCKKLGTLISSGVPPQTAIELCESEASDKEMNAAVQALTAATKAGGTLGDAMSKFPDFFPPALSRACAKPLAAMDIQLIAAGELMQLDARFPTQDTQNDSVRRSHRIYRVLALTTGLGFSIAGALDGLAASGIDENVSGTAARMAGDIRAGMRLSDCMAKQAIFADDDVAMMAAAEVSGIVDIMFSEMAEKLEREISLKTRHDEAYQRTHHVAAIVYSLGLRLSSKKNARVDEALDQTAKYIQSEPFHSAIVNGASKAVQVNGDILLSSVFESNPQVFGPSAAHVARVGENGHVLGIVLLRLGRQYFDEVCLGSTRMDGPMPALPPRPVKAPPADKQSGDF